MGNNGAAEGISERRRSSLSYSWCEAMLYEALNNLCINVVYVLGTRAVWQICAVIIP